MGSSAILKIFRSEAGPLVAQMDGAASPVDDVRVARCFPWSLPTAYFSIRDAGGKELALLKSLDELDPSSRAIVEAELSDRVFTPRITRIVGHKNDVGVISITAETDRGAVTFQLRGRDDVRLLSATRALLTDADGIVYEVPDVGAMDAESRRQLEEYF